MEIIIPFNPVGDRGDISYNHRFRVTPEYPTWMSWEHTEEDDGWHDGITTYYWATRLPGEVPVYEVTVNNRQLRLQMLTRVNVIDGWPLDDYERRSLLQKWWLQLDEDLYLVEAAVIRRNLEHHITVGLLA